MRLARRQLQQLPLAAPAPGEAVADFAAAELARYLRAAGGIPCPPAAATAPPNVLALGRPLAIDPPAASGAFAIAGDDSGITIAGADAAGMLHGVYRLLEGLGCRWSFHGAGAEVVPALADGGVEIAAVRERPVYRVRGYSSDLHTWHYGEAQLLGERLPRDLAFVDWMGKTGANAFFFIRHPFDTQLSIPEMLPEMRRRAIRAEYGGHVIPLLLPRQLFAAHPEYFPEDRDGKRHDLGNACASSDGALQVIASNAVAYAAAHPDMGALHIWGADLWHGGWCHCRTCRPLSVQDQSLRVCNAVADALADAGMQIPVCYLAYHDTVEAALRERPRPGVWVEFAPRERCYGHALADSSCHTNRSYRTAFERYVELFDGRVRVFEYYGDSILFCGCAVPLAELIAADLEYYRRAGGSEITFLQFGAHSLWAHGVNFLAFAAHSRGSCSDEDDAVAYARRGRDPQAARAMWQDVERLMRGVVRYGDVLRPPRQRAADLLPAVGAAVAGIDGWIERLGDSDDLAQTALLQYTRDVLEGVGQSLRGAEPQALALYDRALHRLESVDRRHRGVWGAANLPIIHAFHRGHPQES